MGKTYSKLEPALRGFIARQHVFFTASAAASGRVNLSPRSTDCLRITGDNTIVYLDKTGSGNETAAHALAQGRMTIMLCAFEGPPQIMRLHGVGRVLHRDSDDYKHVLRTWFENRPPVGTRQIIQLDFDLVQTSCGYGVPVFEYKKERSGLDQWAEAKTPAEIEDYWRTTNQISMDGLPTGIFKGD